MADRASLDGDDSVCCDPAYAPIAYIWYRADGGATLVEAFKALLHDEPLTDYLRDQFVGEFRARFRALKEGRLRPIDQVKGPMETEMRFRMYEIRWRFELGDGSDIRVRAYHVEPKSLKHFGGSAVVGLHLHKKTTDAAQDAEIIVAGKRYFAAKNDDWGLA